MTTRFFADYDLNELRTRLNSIIEVENEDNLQTHFRQAILFKDESKVSGTIKTDSFKVWTHSQFGFSAATGIFYPVIEGRPRPLSQGLEIEFNSKMNLIGGAVFILLTIMLSYGIITGIVIQENNELKFLIIRFLLGAVLFGLMISLPTYIYFRTSRITKKYLIKELGLKNERQR